METFKMLVSDILYSKEFMNAAINLTKSKMDAKDLIQDVALKALRFEMKYIGGNLFSWLYIILKNSFLDKNRLRYKYKIILLENPELLSQEWVEPEIFSNDRIKGNSSDIEMLLNGIKKLHKLYRDPIELSLSGYKMNEIASRIGIPQGTVKSRIFTGKQQLKNIYADEYKNQNV